MIVTSKRSKRRRRKPCAQAAQIIGPRIVKSVPRRRRAWPEVEVSEEVWDFFRRMGIKTVPDKS